MRHRRTAPVTVTALLALAVPLAACSTDAAGGDATDGTTAPTPSSSATAGFAPVSLDNCGTKVTVTSPPRRVVTIKSTSTEMMLALGLGDRIIGDAFLDGPVPDQWAAAASHIPSLGDGVPSQESVLALDPDFVYADWESNLSDQGAGDRASYAKLGIGTYVSPSACLEKAYQPDPLTFDDVFGEIIEVGTIFGVPDEAAVLVAQQKQQLAAVEPVKNVTALWWSSGEDTPYAGGGIGAPQMIMDAAGMTNVLANVHDTWATVGWEQLVAADPDVLVLVDASWNTYEKKIADIESNPALQQMTAVKEKRFVRLPFAATEAGVRDVDTVASLVQ